MSSKILLSSLNCLTELNSTELKQVTGGQSSIPPINISILISEKIAKVNIEKEFTIGDDSGVGGDINQVDQISIHQIG